MGEFVRHHFVEAGTGDRCGVEVDRVAGGGSHLATERSAPREAASVDSITGRGRRWRRPSGETVSVAALGGGGRCADSSVMNLAATASAGVEGRRRQCSCRRRLLRTPPVPSDCRDGAVPSPAHFQSGTGALSLRAPAPGAQVWSRERWCSALGIHVRLRRARSGRGAAFCSPAAPSSSRRTHSVRSILDRCVVAVVWRRTTSLSAPGPGATNERAARGRPTAGIREVAASELAAPLDARVGYVASEQPRTRALSMFERDDSGWPNR